MYCGWRARIGLIMPGNGTNPEYEFHKYAPEGRNSNDTESAF